MIRLLAGLGAGLLVAWLALAATLLAFRPKDADLRTLVRLVPDLIRLLKRLSRDRTLPRGVRLRLVALLAYLALPFDLIPDFVPILGYADDAILVVLALRSVVRAAGADALCRHWPGDEASLGAVRRAAGL